jgi:hypothetical protein
MVRRLVNKHEFAMNLEVVGWLVDSETENARISLGPKWPVGHYAESLVKMSDAQNAIAASVTETQNKERKRWADWCRKAAEGKRCSYVATQERMYLNEAAMLDWAARECG